MAIKIVKMEIVKINFKTNGLEDKVVDYIVQNNFNENNFNLRKIGEDEHELELLKLGDEDLSWKLPKCNPLDTFDTMVTVNNPTINGEASCF